LLLKAAGYGVPEGQEQGQHGARIHTIYTPGRSGRMIGMGCRRLTHLNNCHFPVSGLGPGPKRFGTENPRVGSSILSLGILENKGYQPLELDVLFCFLNFSHTILPELSRSLSPQSHCEITASAPLCIFASLERKVHTFYTPRGGRNVNKSALFRL
jgi:hypothetical protein